jgi:hypothetical protein
VLFAGAAPSLGFGAGIVSGYLHNPDQQGVGSSGAGSTHAWADLCPWRRLTTFNPTNRGMGGRRNNLFSRLLVDPLAEPDAGAASVLIDELNTQDTVLGESGLCYSIT